LVNVHGGEPPQNLGSGAVVDHKFVKETLVFHLFTWHATEQVFGKRVIWVPNAQKCPLLGGETLVVGSGMDWRDHKLSGVDQEFVE
jgi:hypothetical protein